MKFLGDLVRMSSSGYNTLQGGAGPDCENGGSSNSNDNSTSEDEALLERSRRKAKRFFDGFIDFAFQGNILQIAFGLILAATFTDLVKSFVADILMPPLSVILPINKNMEEKFAVLRIGESYNKTTGYNTLMQAQSDGAVVMAYGHFINAIISFVMIGLSLYGLALIYTAASNDPIIKHTKKCKYCRQRVNERASRCVNCTSWLDGREDRPTATTAVTM